MASKLGLHMSMSRVAESIVDADQAVQVMRDEKSSSRRHQQYGRVARDMEIIKTELRKMWVIVNAVTQEDQQPSQRLPSNVFEPCAGNVDALQTGGRPSIYYRATCDSCGWVHSKPLKTYRLGEGNIRPRTVFTSAALWKSHWQNTGDAFGCLACHAVGTGDNWYSHEGLVVHWRDDHVLKTLAKYYRNLIFASSRASAQPQRNRRVHWAIQESEPSSSGVSSPV